ncbi:MAG: lysophospholipid acyltransferase family protein [Desulfobacterales bacterium]|nr:lysophospholipid acyltransferase family protein [Desulfobacterales bacterium]
MNTRFVFFALTYLSFGVLLNLVYLILLPFVLISDPLRRQYFKIYYKFHEIVSNLFWETRMTGYQVEKSPRPVIFILNHQTVLDSLPIYLAYPHLCKMVVFSGIRWLPVIGLIHMFLKNIFVNRASKSSRKAALGKSALYLRQGFSLIFAPEGTLNPTESLMPFRIGPFRLACEIGVPVIPVRQETKVLFGNKKGLKLLPGSLRIHFFEPIDTTNKRPEDVRDIAFERIQSFRLT